MVQSIPADLKAKVFASATHRGLPASLLVRDVIIAFTAGKAV